MFALSFSLSLPLSLSVFALWLVLPLLFEQLSLAFCRAKLLTAKLLFAADECEVVRNVLWEKLKKNPQNTPKKIMKRKAISAKEKYPQNLSVISFNESYKKGTLSFS